MVRVAPGSRPPSWSQNEIKVLVNAESSLYIVHFTPLALKTDPTCRGNRMPIMKLDVNVEEYKLVHNLASLVHITDGTLDCYYTVQAARVSHTPT